MANKIDIPNGWEVKKLGEIGNFLKGKGIKKDELCDNGLPCVIYGQIYTSYDFYTDKFTSFIPINLKPYTTEIYQNDILFTGSGETKEEIGKSIAYIGKEYAYAGGDIIILRQDKIISIFITYYLNSIGRKQLNRLGQGDSVVHIYKSILESVKIPVPPLAEQEKIAEILSLWDKAIEHTKELIAYKEKQKKGLMQNLLTGKKRLHGWTDDWKNIELGEVLTERNIYAEKNGKQADLYLAVESGITNSLGRWLITNIAVIEDNRDFESYGTSPSFPVPEKLVKDIIDTDLSQVMNKIFTKDDERHNKGGGIQLLTHEKISRIDLTQMAFIMALTKYINEDKWK